MIRVCYNHGMLTRRDALIAGTVLWLLPSASAAAPYARRIDILSEPFQTLAVVYRDIFPGRPRVPGAHLLKTLDYLGAVLHDPYIDDASKAFLADGARWLNEEALEKQSQSYYRLTASQRQHLLHDISETRWGENWLWTLFAYFFESLLGDPTYGINTHRAGWHWLNHTPGYPRPTDPFTQLPAIMDGLA